MKKEKGSHAEGRDCSLIRETEEIQVLKGLLGNWMSSRTMKTENRTDVNHKEQHTRLQRSTPDV